MEITDITYDQVRDTFGPLKPDLLDKYATYFGAFIKDELVGIVSYVEHEHIIYLCHDYVLSEHRSKGIYKLLSDYRTMRIKKIGKTITAHCNTDSLKNFINSGFTIEKALFKVVKNIHLD